MRFIERLQSGIAGHARGFTAMSTTTARRILIVLSRTRWSGNDGGENCLKRAHFSHKEL
jgi:hypothetical protein